MKNFTIESIGEKKPYDDNGDILEKAVKKGKKKAEAVMAEIMAEIRKERHIQQ